MNGTEGEGNDLRAKVEAGDEEKWDERRMDAGMWEEGKRSV